MSHPETHDWGDDRIVLHIERDEFDAYCSPEAAGEVFVGEEQVSESGERHGTAPAPSTLDMNGAPFPFDIVFHDERRGREAEQELAQELGDAFREKFDERVAEVWEAVEDSDDPLDAVMDMEPESITGDE